METVIEYKLKRAKLLTLEYYKILKRREGANAFPPLRVKVEVAYNDFCILNVEEYWEYDTEATLAHGGDYITGGEWYFSGPAFIFFYKNQSVHGLNELIKWHDATYGTTYWSDLDDLPEIEVCEEIDNIVINAYNKMLS